MITTPTPQQVQQVQFMSQDIYDATVLQTLSSMQDGIQQACEALNGEPSGEITVSGLSNVTTSGNVAAGARFVDFSFSTDFTGTLAGVNFTGAADGGYSLPPIPGAKYKAIAYTVTAGSLRIIKGA